MYKKEHIMFLFIKKNNKIHNHTINTINIIKNTLCHFYNMICNKSDMLCPLMFNHYQVNYKIVYFII